MRLVDELKDIKPHYIIITGDGRRELRVVRGLSKVYNGNDIVLYFPFIPLPRKTGKSALDSVKIIPSNYGINSIIFIVDGDSFVHSANDEILEYIKGIGIEVENLSFIQSALKIKCKFGSHNILLYCIVSGPTTFIEEEIVKLLNIKWGAKIDLSGEKNSEWKKRVKKEVDQTLKHNKKKLDILIKETERKYLEMAFPNLCAVFKEIEKEYYNVL